MYEYKFENPEHYNSLTLVKQKNYSVEDTRISSEDIQKILDEVTFVSEPDNVPFPQADKFERVINICELLDKRDMSKEEITRKYAFDSRQTNYYTDAARYLGLVEKKTHGKIKYSLTESGEKILSFNFKKRQLAYCECILSHRIFADTLKKFFDYDVMPSENDIVVMMKKSDLRNIESNETFERRSSTIRGWINWMVGLINE